MNVTLDLAALEARLKFGDSLDATECEALVLTLWEYREALRDGQTVVIALAQPENIAHKSWLGEMARAFLRRASRALASCTDHEGAPAAQE